MCRFPLISVVLPVYNVEKYISGCLQSLVQQTWEHIEIIAIDDDSTDYTWSVLCKYALRERRLNIFRHSKHKGNPSFARNEGIKIAKGKYVAFVDGDDYVDKYLLEKATDIMEKNTCDILYCAYTVFSDTDSKKAVLDFPNHKNRYDTTHIFNAATVHKDFWIYFNSGACFKMYRTDFLRNEKILFPNLYFEDLPFSFRTFIQARKIAYMPEPLYYYRVERKDGMKSRGDTKTYRQCSDGIKGLRSVYFWLRKNNRYPVWKEEFAVVVYYQGLRWLRDNLPEKYFPLYYRQLRALFVQLAKCGLSYHYFDKESAILFKNICKNSAYLREELCERIHIKNITSL